MADKVSGNAFSPDADPYNADWIKIVGLGGSPRNADLALLYRSHWATLHSLLLEDDTLSCPYLAWVDSAYDEAAIRMVVVGQETNGWGDRGQIDASPDTSVRTLMHEYKDFGLGRDYSHAATFWTPIRRLYELLNPDGPEAGFVALNASILDQRSNQPSLEVRDTLVRTRLLPEQIRLLEPDVVVFHTGPTYDEWLNLSFPGLSLNGDRLFARVEAHGLPFLSFRTYHPGYLARKSQLTGVYDRIVAAVL